VNADGTGDRASAALRQPAARRKFWGWGLEGQGLAASEIEQLRAVFTERLGIDGVRVQEPPRVEELDLPGPRLAPPASLASAFSADPYDRAAHTYGRSFRDLVRAFRRD
jgi:alkyldihydroxyacetonephosphate synthase